jgi:hypothetical protein
MTGNRVNPNIINLYIGNKRNNFSVYRKSSVYRIIPEDNYTRYTLLFLVYTSMHLNIITFIP